MDLRHLRALSAVARERNFTRAARRLRVAQPALSQQIHALEQELGMVLVERTNRTSGLTDAGARLLVRAERILLEVENAAQEMASQAGVQGGIVRVGCAIQTLLEGRLPQLLASFHERHPSIRLLFREVHTRQVLERLRRGDVDLGLIHLGRVDRTLVGLRTASPSLSIARLYTEPLVLIVGPAHRLKDAASVRFEELRGETFIAFRPGATVRQMVSLAARRRGFTPNIGFSTGNMGTVRAFVSAGLGIAIVPRSALDVPKPRLGMLSIVAPRFERIVTLARNTARYETPAVKAVHQLLTSELRKLEPPKS